MISIATYIDSDEAVLKIMSNGIQNPSCCEQMTPSEQEDYVINLIKSCAIADAVPIIIHGRWIPYHKADFGWDEYGHTCSNCGIRIESGTEPCAFYYCPSCGAKMDIKNTTLR